MVICSELVQGCSNRRVLHHPYVFDVREENGRVVYVLNGDGDWPREDKGRLRGTFGLAGEVRLLILHGDAQVSLVTILVV